MNTGAALMLAVAACGARTGLEAQSSEPTSDSSVPDAGIASCNPLPDPTPEGSPFPLCDANAEQVCHQWAQSLTISGYGRATCMYEGKFTAKFCEMADYCSPGEFAVCLCGGRECSYDEVCVSDTPNGRGSCRPVCVPDHDK